MTGQINYLRLCKVNIYGGIFFCGDVHGVPDRETGGFAFWQPCDVFGRPSLQPNVGSCFLLLALLLANQILCCARGKLCLGETGCRSQRQNKDCATARLTPPHPPQ